MAKIQSVASDIGIACGISASDLITKPLFCDDVFYIKDKNAASECAFVAVMNNVVITKRTGTSLDSKLRFVTSSDIPPNANQKKLQKYSETYLVVCDVKDIYANKSIILELKKHHDSPKLKAYKKIQDYEDITPTLARAIIKAGIISVPQFIETSTDDIITRLSMNANNRGMFETEENILTLRARIEGAKSEKHYMFVKEAHRAHFESEEYKRFLLCKFENVMPLRLVNRLLKSIGEPEIENLDSVI